MMENITIDTGAIQFDVLRKTFINYEKLIFDLDDTVFSEDIYDYSAFRSIAIKFYSMNDVDADLYSKKGIFQKRLSRERLFDRISPDSKKEIIKPIVDYYQNYKCGNILRRYSISDILKEMYLKGKQLFVVTNGHPVRQMNKIKDLGIECYLSGIYICHPLTDHLMKPNGSVLDKIGVPFGSKDYLMIGDNAEIDGGFAKSKSIDFYLFKFPKSDI